MFASNDDLSIQWRKIKLYQISDIELANTEAAKSHCSILLKTVIDRRMIMTSDFLTPKPYSN